MAEPKYQRLTRERTPMRFAVASVSRSSLWLGDDHLLFVECAGYTETYKRFYYRDIQAFIIRKTTTRAVWNWITGSLAAVCALAVFGSWRADGLDSGMVIFFSIVFLFFAVLLALNNLSGATCACQIRTAVQTEELPSLCRLRQTRRVLDKIRPLIVAAQGQLTAEEVSARMLETIQAENPAEPPEPASPGSAPPVIS